MGKLAAWDRMDVTCQVVPGKAATRVVIDHAGGGHDELEASNIGHSDDPLDATLAEFARR